MRLAYTAEERLAVELSTNVNYRDLTAEIVSEAEGWLTYTIARPTEAAPIPTLRPISPWLRTTARLRARLP